MDYNSKNYNEQGGESTHFGGTVTFDSGCSVSGFPLEKATASKLGGVKVGDGLAITSAGVLSVSAATKAVVGGVLAVDNVADSSADTVAGVNTVLNSLLAALRTAGVLVTVAE